MWPLSAKAHTCTQTLRDRRPAPSVASGPVTRDTSCMFSMLRTAVKDSSAGSQGFGGGGEPLPARVGQDSSRSQGCVLICSTTGSKRSSRSSLWGLCPPARPGPVSQCPWCHDAVSLPPQRHCPCRESPLGGEPRAPGQQKGELRPCWTAGPPGVRGSPETPNGGCTDNPGAAKRHLTAEG